VSATGLGPIWLFRTFADARACPRVFSASCSTESECPSNSTTNIRCVRSVILNLDTRLRSAVGERESGAESGEERLANRSRSATSLPSRRRKPAAFCGIIGECPLVTSARFAERNGRGRGGGKGPNGTRGAEQTARWSRRVALIWCATTLGVYALAAEFDTFSFDLSLQTCKAFRAISICGPSGTDYDFADIAQQSCVI